MTTHGVLGSRQVAITTFAPLPSIASVALEEPELMIEPVESEQGSLLGVCIDDRQRRHID